MIRFACFNKMIRFAGQTLFRMSTFSHKGSILLNGPSPFDMSIPDISAEGLKDEVSDLLQIPYLSKYDKSIEELKEKVKYKGKIIGDQSRLFFSLPTARVNSTEYYNVHYILDTASPYTTLTP